MTIRAVLWILLAAAGPAEVLAEDDAKAATICREAEERYRQITGSDSTEARPAVVLMYKYTFCPQRLTLKRGDTVRWLNVDRRTTHSVWFKDAGRPESDRKFPEEEIQMVVDLPAGEHRYLCGPHWEREGMIGTLIVAE